MFYMAGGALRSFQRHRGLGKAFLINMESSGFLPFSCSECDPDSHH